MLGKGGESQIKSQILAFKKLGLIFLYDLLSLSQKKVFKCSSCCSMPLSKPTSNLVKKAGK